MTNRVNLTHDQKAMFQQLELIGDKVDKNDEQQLISILNQYLNYPSNRLAKIHRDTNQLGEYDKQQKRKHIKNDFMITASNVLICECCHCFHQNNLSLTTDISQISTLSSSIQLYFSDVKYSAIWCFISFCILGIFGILTNILSYQYYEQNNLNQCIRSRCILTLISLGSKLNYQDQIQGNKFKTWQTGILILLVFVWLTFFIFKQKIQNSFSIQQQLKNISVTDFSVLIKDLPISYSKQVLQQQFDNYVKINQVFQHNSIQTGDKYDQKLTIINFNQIYPYYQVINIPQSKQQFYNRQLIKQRKQKLKEWILFYKYNKQFPISRQQRLIVYSDIVQKQLEVIKKQQQLKNNLFIKMNEILVSSKTRPVIVTFHHTYAKYKILNQNIPNIIIQQAPNPEDIIWQNFGIPLKMRICSKILTYFQIFIILVLCCFILYILSLLQIYYLNAWQFSVIISIIITIFNQILFCNNLLKQKQFIIFQVMNKIGLLQCFKLVSHKNYCFSNYQLHFNQYFCQSFDQKQQFLKRRTSRRCFFLINYEHNITTYHSNFRFERYLQMDQKKMVFITKQLFYNLENKIIFQNQIQYNLLWQKTEYKVIFSYVYIIQTIIFTSFFLSLQPIISLVSCIGIIIIYYAEKYCLFKRCCRPKIRFSSLINYEINQLLKLSIISFSIGNLFFNYDPNKLNYNFKQNILNICILFLGLFFFFVPIKKILKYFSQIPQQVGLLFQNQKILFPQQYQRVNPFTKKQGIKQFGQYILNLKIKCDQNNKNFIQILSYVIDEYPSNPIQGIYKIKYAILACSQNRKTKNLMLTQILQQHSPQTRILNIQSKFVTDGEFSNVNITLVQNLDVQISLLQTIKLSEVKNQSILNNSLLNEIIKPKQILKQNKDTNILFDLIHSILQISDNDRFKQKICWSSPFFYERKQQINQINRSYKPTTLCLIEKVIKY